MKNIVGIFFVMLLLVACVTEEGAKQHRAQAYTSDGSWESVVYPKPGSDGVAVGMFNSRGSCADHAKQHMMQHQMQQGIFSCNRK